MATQNPVLLADLAIPPTYGKFVHVAMDVTWSPTAGSVRVALDGVSVFENNAIANALSATTTSVDVSVGWVEAAGATPAAEMSIDNVAVQLR